MRVYLVVVSLLFLLGLSDVGLAASAGKQEVSGKRVRLNYES
jgi:hypothetical protein